MSRLRLALLGPPQAFFAGRRLQFRTRKVLALLIYLAVENRPAARDHLAALFWPDSDQARARASLRRALTLLRQAVGADTLLAESDTIALNGALVDLDLHNLQPAELGKLPEAVAAYRGDFLEGFSLPDAEGFDEWAAVQREHWHERLGAVLDRLSRLHGETGEFSAAREAAARWAAHAPLDEAAHRRVMQLHFAAGDKPAALQAYEAARALLATELGAAPSPETQALFNHIRAAPAPARFEPPNAPTPLDALDLPFVGRSEEHGRLAGAFHAARQGRARLALIEGEAGIGKTRLADEFSAWAAAQGADVLRGRALEAGGRLPYQPLIEALRARLERANAPEDLLADVWLAELSRLLPELRERYPDLPAPIGDEALARARLPEAVARLGLALAARAAPKAAVVLFVDDIQWADAASLDLLHYLARRWKEAAAPILIVLAARNEPQPATAAIAEWIASVERELELTRVTLHPISQAQTRQLIEALGLGAHSQALGDWLYAETQGQPFFVSETLKILKARGALPGPEEAEFSVEAARGLMPPGVRQVILQRLSRLSAPASALLVAAAVTGRETEFDLLRHISALPEGETLAALDELLAGRLLLEAPRGAGRARLSISHDKIRDVAYHEAAEPRRALYHGRALAALEASGAPPAELARHALAAGRVEAAFRHSLAAGEAAMAVFAVRDAVSQYEQARALLPGLPAPAGESQAYDLLARLGRAYEILGEVKNARRIYQTLLDTARAANSQRPQTAALNALAMLSVHTYEFEPARVMLQEAAAVAASGGDTEGALRSELGLAQLGHHRLDIRGSLEHSRQALHLARQLDDPEQTASVLNSLAYAEMLLGGLADGEGHMAEAHGLYAGLGNRAMEADCLTALAAVQIWRGRAADGIETCRAALAISQEIENPWGIIYSSNWLAQALIDLGRSAEALDAAEVGRRQATAHDFAPVALLNCLILGNAQRALDRLGAARETHLQAKAMHEAMPASHFSDLIAGELCADCALAGDWETAADYARQALARRTYTSLPLVTPLRWPETEALARAGELEAARADLKRWGDLAGHVPRLRIAHLSSLAALAESEVDHQAAQAHRSQARDLLAQFGLAVTPLFVGDTVGA